MNSRIISLAVLLLVAAAGVGLMVYVLQAPKDPEGLPQGPGFEVPDYTKNPPPKGPGAGDPAKMGAVDRNPDDGAAKKGTPATGPE
jgi:hypothetical protein